MQQITTYTNQILSSARPTEDIKVYISNNTTIALKVIGSASALIFEKNHSEVSLKGTFDPMLVVGMEVFAIFLNNVDNKTYIFKGVLKDIKKTNFMNPNSITFIECDTHFFKKCENFNSDFIKSLRDPLLKDNPNIDTEIDKLKGEMIFPNQKEKNKIVPEEIKSK